MKLPRFAGAILLALCMAGCGEPKLDAPAAAAKFFELLGKKQIQEAYDSAAFSFQSAQTLKTFEFTVESLGMQANTSIQWKTQWSEGREAKLEGEILKANGEKQKVTALMIRESGEWKLHALRIGGIDSAQPGHNPFTLVGKGASFNEALRRNLPSKEEIKRLTLLTVLDFNAGIQKGSFADFYETISMAWQTQLTKRKMQNAFQPFIDAGVKLEAVQSLEPIFDPEPEINGEGLLVVSGFYPTTPYRVVFSMKFIYELPKWKLFGLDINLIEPK